MMGAETTEETDSDLTGAAERQAQLEGRRETLKAGRSKLEGRAPRYLLGGTLLVLFAPILVAVLPDLRIIGIYPSLYGLALIAASIIQRQQIRHITEDITDLNNELDLLDLLDDPRELRATKLLQVNQLDLRRYYDQTLRQGSQIFYVGVLCIALGFAIVGASFWLVQSSELSELSEKIVVASLGAVGGILANFIAVIYLQMFSKTIESVGTFHQRLSLRDRLNFGNILAAKIDDDEVRDETLSEMAIELSGPSEEVAGAQGNATGAA